MCSLLSSRLRAGAVPLLLVFSFTLSACGGGSSTPVTGKVTLTTDADWVAFQDGPNGKWKQKSPDSTGGRIYTLKVTDANGLYGIAVHRFNSSGNSVLRVVQATLSDWTSVSLALADDAVGNINATVSGLTTGDTATVQANGAPKIYSSDTTQSLIAWTGANDVVAIEQDSSGQFVGGVVNRNVTVGATAVASSVDLSAPTLTANLAHTYTSSASGANAGVDLLTANGALGQLSDGAGNYVTVNGAASTDLYRFFAYGPSSYVGRYFATSTDPGDQTIDPSTIAPFYGTMDASGMSGLDYVPAASSPALSLYEFEPYQFRSPYNVQLYYVLTPAWLGTNTTYTRPDFSSVSGFDTGWDLAAGVSVNGMSFAMMDTLGTSGMNLSARYIVGTAGERYDQADGFIGFTP
jgi:hypothetical protein